MKYQKIYDKSPMLFQNLMVTIYGYKEKKKRYGKVYYDYLEHLKEVHKLTQKELEELQFKELMELLKNTVNKSRFYRELYKDIDIDRFTSVIDLEKLPIVDKELIRQNIDDIVTISKKDASITSTGGTTGKSLTVYRSKEDDQKRKAILDYFKLKHGFKNIEMKKATFMGKHIIPPSQKRKVYWRYNGAIKQMVYSSFHITEENIPYYIESLNKFKPESIDGFISSIYDIALYINKNNIKLEFQPKAIFPTSETVTLEHRDVVEKAFKSKIRDQYASSEGAPFVWECKCGNYHYDITTGVIEKMGNSNEILVTSFTTNGTPLIRYRIGDSMIFEEPNKSCKCGFNTPLVRSIEGRVVDYLYSTDGGKINLGNISNIFKNMPNIIIKAQLIQKGLNNMTVKIVIDGTLTNEYEKKLTDEIKHKFGNDMKIEFKIVEDIPKEKSGKYKLIVNRIK